MSPRRFDVVVVGGGVAGLAAAEALVRQGKRILLVEARDRWGGRVWSDHAAGRVPREWGAEFVQGRPRDVLAWLKRAGAHMGDADGPHLLRTARGLGAGDDAMDLAMKVLARPRTPDCSVAHAVATDLRGNAAARHMALAYTEGFFAAPAAHASANAIAIMVREQSEVDGDDFHRVREGYDRMVDALVKALPAAACELTRAVTAVTWKRNDVRLTLRDTRTGRREEVHTRAAVITVPLPILQRGIRFTPRLPMHRAIAALAMGDVCKVHLELASGTVLTRHPFTFIHAPNADFPTFWRTAPLNANALVAWAAGPKADALRELSHEKLIARAITSLAHAVGQSPAALARAVHAADAVRWSEDRWAQGAYAVVPVGRLPEQLSLAVPVEDTLFLAGEATSVEFAGTVQGALRSGVRAARQIAECPS